MPIPHLPLPAPIAALDRDATDHRERYHRRRRPAVYLHIPFCRAICPYCDFNTYARKEGLIPRYVDALAGELARWHAAVELAGRAVDRPVPSVYLGGGTPSLLSPDAVARLVAAGLGTTPRAGDVEVTMEANPGTVNEAYCRAVVEAGVNRISLGAQTFQPRGLKRLGRGHGAGGTEAAVAAARAAGIDNLSLDLMFGWPEQTLAEWSADLDRALALEPDHFSLYSLQVESGTPFGRLADRGRLPLPSDDAVADMYDLARERLAAAGFRHYEISSWCRLPRPGEPPRDFRSRHNLIYWRNDEYLGLGAGAHGFALGHRWVDTRRPEAYVRALAAGTSAAEEVERIDLAREVSDTLIMGLRLDDGVGRRSFAERFGMTIESIFGNEIDTMVSQGWLDADPDSVRLTPDGRFVANEVFVRFLSPVLPVENVMAVTSSP